MKHVPYVRLKAEDLRGSDGICGWTVAAPWIVEALGLPPERVIPIPLAGPAGNGSALLRRQGREGLATLLALDPSHCDRTLYLEIIDRCYPRFERWLQRKLGRAFSSGRYDEGLREAAALVNLRPGRAEARFNLGLLLTRILSLNPDAVDVARFRDLARDEFERAAELSPELFWGYYHRGVLAYEAGRPEESREDWVRFLDRYMADKPAARSLSLPLLPLSAAGEMGELPGLAYTVLLDLLGLSLPQITLPPAPAGLSSTPD